MENIQNIDPALIENLQVEFDFVEMYKHHAIYESKTLDLKVNVMVEYRDSICAKETLISLMQMEYFTILKK